MFLVQNVISSSRSKDHQNQKLVDWLEYIRDELFWVLLCSVGAAKWFHFSLSSDEDLDEWEIGKREVWQQFSDHRNYSEPLLGIIGQIGFPQKSKTIYNLVHLK